MGLLVTPHDRREHDADSSISGDTVVDLSEAAEFGAQVEKVLIGRRRFEQQISLFVLELTYNQLELVDAAQGERKRRLQPAPLQTLLDQIKRCLRQGDIVGSLPPDKLAIVPAVAQNSREAAAIAARLLDVARRNSEVAGGRASWIPRVGIARFPTDATSVSGLLQTATQACSRVTGTGGNRYCFYAEVLNQKSNDY